MRHHFFKLNQILGFLSILIVGICRASDVHIISLQDILKNLETIQTTIEQVKKISHTRQLYFDWQVLADDIRTIKDGIIFYTEYPHLNAQILPFVQGDYIKCGAGA